WFGSSNNMQNKWHNRRPLRNKRHKSCRLNSMLLSCFGSSNNMQNKWHSRRPLHKEKHSSCWLNNMLLKQRPGHSKKQGSSWNNKGFWRVAVLRPCRRPRRRGH
ncbi:unnamed protein product, partial [Durusdinium trenchii]